MMRADALWHRGTLHGFHEVALERGWNVVRIPPDYSLREVLAEWDPRAVVLGPGVPPDWPGVVGDRLVVLANPTTRPESPIPTVCVDDAAVGELAARHLLARGLKYFSAFRHRDASFARIRAERFAQVVASAAGTRLDDGGEFPLDVSGAAYSATMIPWLLDLPKPCGLLACSDAWASLLAHYCRRARIRIPEDIALLGVDNDPLECELTVPPLSSIAIPWQQMGREIAQLLHLQLQGLPLPQGPVLIPPAGVVPRRSSDVLAVSDPDVAAAVTWIRHNAHRRLSVPDILHAVPVFRHKLERRFRAVLGRTIMQEARRAHVAVAERLLATTSLSMPQIAERSGFSNGTLMGIAFRRETGIAPRTYRRLFAAALEPDLSRAAPTAGAAARADGAVAAAPLTATTC